MSTVDLQEQMNKAKALYDKGQEEKAVAIWQGIYDQGYLAPAYYLGMAYASGKLIEHDEEKAYRFFRSAVGDEKSPAAAYYEYAQCLALGRGVKPSPVRAFMAYKEAATKGHMQALYKLSRCYHQGLGVEQDDEQALECLLKSAHAGVVKANVDLGHYYLAHDEPVKAYSCFRLAAEGGSAHALYVQAQLTRDGEGVAEPNPKAALPMLRKAAEMGNHDALNDMGYIYEDGTLVKQDYKKAAEYYRKAVAAGNGGAYANLGLLYANGRGVEKDPKMAALLFGTGANDEDLDAENFANSDLRKAYLFHKKTNNAPDAVCLFYYGMMYFLGEGGKKQDYAKAYGYIQQAADLGEGYAYNALGVMYEKGLGVKKNLTKAKKYHKLAEEAGCVEDLEVK